MQSGTCTCEHSAASTLVTPVSAPRGGDANSLHTPHASTSVLASAPVPDQATDGKKTLTLFTVRFVRGLLYLEGQLLGKPCKFLIDSGAAACFVSKTLAHGLMRAKQTPDSVILADGSSIISTHVVPAARLRIGRYTDSFLFHVVDLSGFDAVLGKDWLTRLNPNIDWRAHRVTVTHNGRSCHLRAPPAKKSGQHPLLLSHQQFKKALRHHEPVYTVHMRKIDSDHPLTLLDAPSPVVTLASAAVSAVATTSPDPADPAAKADDSAPPPSGCGVARTVCDLTDLLDEFSDVFPDDLPPGLPPARALDHKIEILPGAKPPNAPIYRMAPTQLAELKAQLEELIDKGFLIPSVSEWASPVMMVPKKDGGSRLVCDYRATNLASKKQASSIARVDDLLDQLHGAKILSKADLRSGYHLIRMDPASVPYTTIKTKYGLYAWTVMPFGLQGAPQTFTTLMTDIFRDLLDQGLLVYLDDLCLYTKDEASHRRLLRTVLERLRAHKLYCKRSKCAFGVDRVDFLGFCVSGDGISCDPGKIRAIRDWPTPTSVSDVRSFLGLANYYRRFVRNFAARAAPLHELLKADTAWAWTPERHSAFQDIQNALMSAPVVIAPDFSRPFVLRTDASKYAVGAVLSQTVDGEERVVAYESRKLNKHEMNYEVHDKELLAIVHSLRTWRHYLLGQRFSVLTDNTPAKHILTKSTDQLNERQARWLAFLADFDFDIQHIPGRTNSAPDALSRRADYMLSALRSSTVTIQPSQQQRDILTAVFESATSDPTYQAALEATREGKASPYTLHRDVLFHTASGRLYVPAGDLQTRLLHEAHDTPTSGHLGRHKTLARLQEHFFWPYMDKSVRDYVRSCAACQLNKPPSRAPYGMLMSLPVPDRPWQSASLDFIGVLPTTESGHDMILVFVCRLTKMIHLIPCKSTADAQEIAALFIKHIYRLHGLPSQLVSDRDSKFTSDFWQALFSQLGSKLSMSTANHPQTDGQTERANRTVEEMLRMFVSPFQNDWDEHLALVEFAYNSSKHASSSHSPFELNYGFIPDDPLSAMAKSAGLPSSSRSPITDHSADALLDALRDRLAHAKACLAEAQAAQAAQYNKKRRDGSFKVGDKVKILRSHFAKAPTESENSIRKLGAAAYGPFTVIEVINANAYRLDLSDSGLQIHPVLPIARLEHWVESDPAQFPGRKDKAAPRPPAVVKDGEEYFTVASFVGKRGSGKKLQYRVQWAGFGAAHNKWLPATHLQSDLGDPLFQSHVDNFNAVSTAVKKSKQSKAKSKSKTKKKKP